MIVAVSGEDGRAPVPSRDAVSRRVRVIGERLAADSILRKRFTEAIDVKFKTRPCHRALQSPADRLLGGSGGDVKKHDMRGNTL